jgi:formate dehydrogenase subunit gamma
MSRPSTAGTPGAWDPAEVERITHGLKDQDGALIPILHAVQERAGYIDERAVPVIAEVLNLTRAEVHGVVSFYHDFRRAPAGSHVVKVCCAEACQAMGSDKLVADLEGALGIKLGATTPDRRVTIEAVYCLGNCALSPAVMVDGELKGRVSAADVLTLAGRGAG